MEESGLDWTHCNPMRWPCRPPTREPWRLPKPSKVTLRGSTTNVEEGHESAAIAEVNLGPSPEVDLGPGLEVNLGPNLETGLGPILGTKLEPTVKAAPMLIPKVCGPSLWANPQIEG